MITGFLQFVKIRIKIREELLYRIMIGTYLSLTLDSIRKIVSIVYSFIPSKKMVRKWNALHGRGSRSRGKKMLIFRSRTLPETFTGRLYHVASSRSNIQRAACFFTRRGGGRWTFTNKRRRLNVQGKWPAIWRPPLETATPREGNTIPVR